MTAIHWVLAQTWTNLHPYSIHSQIFSSLQTLISASSPSSTHCQTFPRSCTGNLLTCILSRVTQGVRLNLGRIGFLRIFCLFSKSKRIEGDTEFTMSRSRRGFRWFWIFWHFWVWFCRRKRWNQAWFCLFLGHSLGGWPIVWLIFTCWGFSVCSFSFRFLWLPHILLNLNFTIGFSLRVRLFPWW